MLQWEHCRREIESRLERTGRRLFAELTGCPLRVAWRPRDIVDGQWLPPPCRTATCRTIHRIRDAGNTCRRCAADSMTAALHAGEHGHVFVCPFGMANCWQPISVGPCHLGFAFFQIPARQLRKESGQVKFPGRNRGAKPMCAFNPLRCPRFARARHALRLVLHDAVETALADLREDEVLALSQNVVAHEHVEADLRAALHRTLPLAEMNPATPDHESHREQLVHRMLDYLHTGYARPISLSEYAASVGMNLTYLSALFSESVGLPFRSYLRHLRLEKARALLRDPLKRVSEIATAVGCTSPNRLRLNFKELTGLSPSAWRQTITPGE